MQNLALEISDFLGYCDLNGVDALDSSQVEKLEDYIYKCNAAMAKGDTPLVVDAIYDRMCEILKQVNPDAEILGQLWSDADDNVTDEDLQSDDLELLKRYPMMSICTCKSFDCDELKDFVNRLPDGISFDAHISCKENGHGIRIVYRNGVFSSATSRMRSSGGHVITNQLSKILSKAGLLEIPELSYYNMVEIRGELLLPLRNLSKAREFNPDIVSAFSGVSSMLRDSASDEEHELLEFVAYKIIADDEGLQFDTFQQEYDYLEELGFSTPLYWVVSDLTKETLLSELPNIVSDCEEEVMQSEDGEGGYEYYTDGLVFSINDKKLFSSLGSDGKKYAYGNVALKVGFWQQDLYYGYVQTILWTDGKVKYSPVAIIADEPDVLVLKDEYANTEFIADIKEIENWKDLGVVTAGGNKVRRVPLYEPNNMLILDAYKGQLIYFRYGGEAGVVPCFSDGTPLSDSKIRQMFTSDEEDEYTYNWEDYAI